MYQNNFPFKRYQITVDFINKHIGKNEFILDLGVEIKDTSSGTDWNLKS